MTLPKAGSWYWQPFKGELRLKTTRPDSFHILAVQNPETFNPRSIEATLIRMAPDMAQMLAHLDKVLDERPLTQVERMCLRALVEAVKP